MRITTVLLLLVVFIAACDDGYSTDGGSSNDDNNPPVTTQPDLVITDIAVIQTRDDNVDMVVAVKNQGSSFNRDFEVWCEVPCRTDPGWSPKYFSGGLIQNGMGAGEATMLGAGVWLNLSECPFATYREFTCTADANNNVPESNEGNNVYSENVYTGR